MNGYKKEIRKIENKQKKHVYVCHDHNTTHIKKEKKEKKKE